MLGFAVIVAAVNAEAWGRNQQGSLSYVYVFTVAGSVKRLGVAAKKVDAPRAAAPLF